LIGMTGGARDLAVIRYYDRRAAEYDDWYLGSGLFADRERPEWETELAAVVHAIGSLDPKRTLDVACGTAFITRHLPGNVVALDFSQAMLDVARSRVITPLVRGDALALPFGDGTFERIFTGHFYGHLRDDERMAFLREARRVGHELIVLDAARRERVPGEQMQERTLSDGSRHVIYKRFFRSRQLSSELGSGRALFEGRWFVLVSSAEPLS
jgi:ubiquinone/menaquinone biosynthesis C-methylase UbiE